MNDISTKLLAQLQNETKKINDLDPEKAIHREAVFHYLSSRASLIKTLKTPTEIAFLKKCLERDYKLFLHLKPEQYDEEMAGRFLYNSITSTKDYDTDFIKRSFDESLILNIIYKTHDGEQILYYDNVLEVSTFLIADIQYSFKINSIISFFKKMDVSISMLGYNSIKTELIRWSNIAYRRAINKFIENKKLDVYKITGLYGEIEEEIINELNKMLEDSGLGVQKVNVNKISIPESTSKLLEQQSLALVNEKNRRNNELEYEKKSLDNYERKAEIHSKNPNFEMTLTEAEKDFALNRYAIKHDVDCNKYNKEFESSNDLADRKVKLNDATIKKSADVPRLETSRKSIAPIFYVLGVIMTIISLSIIFDELGIGLILLSVAILFIGFGIAISLYMRKFKGISSDEQKAEYEAQQAEYKAKGGKF